MPLFVDAIAAKELTAPALNTLVGDHKKMFEASYAQTLEAIRSLVKRAIKSGDIRRDLDPKRSRQNASKETRTMKLCASLFPSRTPSNIHAA